ncbi:M48 family metallopeptidase [Paludibaculum fermentans]|uniref:M48 family metallopeptidase n=1 Tax=Paludibaculum fermentans TaxID=1473598 RepID=A0A7S7NUW4_PALFE|nr:SprT family zinc-dependent metalloprotease [Paludibaculum fermentans]QOY90178.1 M48 family metallopeptidase [Paludibaculum fermentans]
MKLEQYSIDYGRYSISYTVVRRVRKTLEIAVEPDSTVSIAAPISASAESIAAKVRKRAPWILAQQRYFDQFNPRTPARRYVAGETHLYLGRQYRLRVTSSQDNFVKLMRGIIEIQSCHPDSREETKVMLDKWYRAKARTKFLERIEACLVRFSRPETVTPKSLALRFMPKRWGSMSGSGRLSLNLRLIQAPVYAIDYVITHELCHRIEPSHSPRYFRILKRAMNDWEKRKERLEQILA